MVGDSRGRGRVGVVVPYTNTNLELDLFNMRPAGVSLHFTRVAGYDANCLPGTDEMKRMANTPVDAALDLLAAIQPGVVLYGCASASLALGLEGDRALAARMSAQCGTRVITAAGAIVQALTELALSNIAICSPYDRTLSESTANFFITAGFGVTSTSTPEQGLDSLEQGLISPDEVVELALEADRKNAEAIVIACTDMRAVECIDAIEARLGKPVISSNQALMYAALGELGITSMSIPGILGRANASEDQRHGPGEAPVMRPFGETAWADQYFRKDRRTGELPT